MVVAAELKAGTTVVDTEETVGLGVSDLLVCVLVVVPL